MAYLVMLINHLDVRILIGFVFLHKQKGKLIQVSARNQHTLAKEKFLCQGLESEEEAETGWKPRKGTHVYHESGGTLSQGVLAARGFLNLEGRMEKLDARTELEEKKNQKAASAEAVYFAQSATIGDLHISC